ncbi:type II toxin-antitoxin system HicB family antitoxin [Paraburkholderia azotifigens]|uniref:type II toxin-antitoxin system HicB family antitoxin n=1 Tax=Paraburkholderia azotifigens TaxID=2057004 RepID=UPI00317931DC
MKFLVAVHKQPGTSYGVTVPDFPGCHSAGETVEQALESTLEAIEGWIATSLEAGDEVRFEATPFEQLRDSPDYAGAFWAVVDVDPTEFAIQPECFAISVPRFVLSQIDAYAKARKETRGGFLVRAALEKIRKDEAYA